MLVVVFGVGECSVLIHYVCVWVLCCWLFGIGADAQGDEPGGVLVVLIGLVVGLLSVHTSSTTATTTTTTTTTTSTSTPQQKTHRPLCSTREGKDSRPRMRVHELRKCRT